MFVDREKEVNRIIEFCKAGRPVVISSHPGLGATALLRHGVAPVLREVGFIVAEFHEWQGKFFRSQLVDLIANSVREQADQAFLAQSETLSEMLTRIHSVTGRPVALLFDQFEDYLRCHSGTSMSDSFDAELSTAVLSDASQMVVAMQDHGLRAFQRMEQFVPGLMASHHWRFMSSVAKSIIPGPVL